LPLQITIKRLRTQDIPQVHRVLNASFDFLQGVYYPVEVIASCRNIYSLDKLNWVFAGSNIIALGAYEGSKLVGCVWGYSAKDGTFAVDWAVVLPSFIGQGIFSRLIEALEQQLRRKHTYKCYFFTSINNTPAIHRYLKLGYRIEGEHLNHFFGWDWLSIGKIISRRKWT
jgi:ribosomal protein S18 acetylase RimI-like enzyme